MTVAVALAPTEPSQPRDRVAERRLNFPRIQHAPPFNRRSATPALRTCPNRGMNPTATVTASLALNPRLRLGLMTAFQASGGGGRRWVEPISASLLQESFSHPRARR